MGVTMYFLYAAAATVTASLFIRLLMTTAAGSAIYLGIMTLTGGVTREDAKKIPFFGKFFYQ